MRQQAKRNPVDVALCIHTTKTTTTKPTARVRRRIGLLVRLAGFVKYLLLLAQHSNRLLRQCRHGSVFDLLLRIVVVVVVMILRRGLIKIASQATVGRQERVDGARVDHAAAAAAAADIAVVRGCRRPHVVHQSIQLSQTLLGCGGLFGVRVRLQQRVVRPRVGLLLFGRRLLHLFEQRATACDGQTVVAARLGPGVQDRVEARRIHSSSVDATVRCFQVVVRELLLQQLFRVHGRVARCVNADLSDIHSGKIAVVTHHQVMNAAAAVKGVTFLHWR